jgi:hypothetical protein
MVRARPSRNLRGRQTSTWSGAHAGARCRSGRQGISDLDEKGIAKTSHEEKLRARQAESEHKKMADLYRQVVLKNSRRSRFKGAAARREDASRPSAHKPTV